MEQSNIETTTSNQLVDHFFRHEYGRMVALLSRVFGLRNLDLVEDMVQSALVQALQSWRTQGIPDEPAAWVYRVARNKVLDALRREETAQRLAPAWLEQRPIEVTDDRSLEDLFLDSEIEDSLLRMIFACSHPSLPMESRLALTLKTLCGFSLSEIARALLNKEEAIKKRIQRAKQQLIDNQVSLEVPTAEELPERLETVHAVLYLLFNEGYSATTADEPIRQDLCEEAMRLCQLLCVHAHCSTSSTFALMALMMFHAARFESRMNNEGVVLLEDQDRSLWDQRLIREGIRYLHQSAKGSSISRYQLEAGIAMYHCKSKSYADTNWAAIVKHYELLYRLNPSPLYLLNRAIALSYVEGPAMALETIEEIREHPQLKDYHLLAATIGELSRRDGQLEQARHHFGIALKQARSTTDRKLIQRRLALCSS